MGADDVEVTRIVVACAAPPAPEFVTRVVTIRVIATFVEGVGGDVVGELGEVGLVCVFELGPTWVISGAVSVESTVERLFTTTVDGPAGEKEKDVGVVTMPGKDTGDCQYKAMGHRANTMLPVLFPAIVGLSNWC